MSVFDLLFICVILSVCVGILTALALWISGRRPAALRVAQLIGIGVVVYGVALVIVSEVSAPRELTSGQDRCYDDWCIAVVGAGPQTIGGARVYAVTFRLSNRALRVAQREQGLVVHLLDQAGKRYEARAAPGELPFDTRLQASESVLTTRWFDVPAGAAPLRLAIAHEGSAAAPGLFIIGDDSSWLHQPTIMKLPDP